MSYEVVLDHWPLSMQLLGIPPTPSQQEGNLKESLELNITINHGVSNPDCKCWGMSHQPLRDLSPGSLTQTEMSRESTSFHSPAIWAERGAGKQESVALVGGRRYGVTEVFPSGRIGQRWAWTSSYSGVVWI